MDNQTTTGNFQPSEQAAQQCFIAHSYNALWHPTIVEVCQEVLPRFGLQPWYADEHFDTTIPLREKVVEMIATTRYGIYDLSYWKPRGSTQWEMPRNVLIELGMAIALNRPMLLLRHAENEACNIALPVCLQGIEQIYTFTGTTTLRKALETSLPQWIYRSPEREWRNRYCHFGGLVCSYRVIASLILFVWMGCVVRLVVRLMSGTSISSKNCWIMRSMQTKCSGNRIITSIQLSLSLLSTYLILSANRNNLL